MSEILCPVCFRHCRLRDGQLGFCRARKNEGGRSVCTNYGKVTSLALDPIEKKPLARFYPGSRILSAGSFGCNMDCPFCQNDAISCAAEQTVQWELVSPEELAQSAEALKPRGNLGVAFTYNEPMIGYEFVRDTAKLVRERGLKNVVVTNGAFCPETLGEVLPYIDAFNIDLKGFTEGWYRTLGGDLETVKAFIKQAAASSHVELTALIVPGGNDSEDEMRRLAKWVASVDKTMPLHITRFFPRRKYADRAPTSIPLLRRLAAIADESLDTVLIGNI
jgi:pyruvate formate lyase activating enzyme